MKIIPKKLNLSVTVPPSKSYIHRIMICSYLARQKFQNTFYSDDIKATETAIKNITENSVINCNESASTLRFLIPLVSVLKGEGVFVFEDSLNKRPINEYYEIFKSQDLYFKKEQNRLKIKGKLNSGKYKVKGNTSSQFLTGLMFALPLLSLDSEIYIEENLQSKPYIDITLSVLKSFGIEITNKDYSYFYIKGNQKYTPSHLQPEGDWSCGVFWYLLNMNKHFNTNLCHNINILNLNQKSIQADAVVQNITPNLSKEFNAQNSPDLVPCLCAYAIGTNQECTITGCQRLKYKECDRLSGLLEFKKVGANINVTENSVIIKKSVNLHSGELSTFSDHRMAMAYTLFSFLTGYEILIDNPSCINKSYPNLFEIINKESK